MRCYVFKLLKIWCFVDGNLERIFMVLFSCILPMECILIREISVKDENVMDREVTTKSLKFISLKHYLFILVNSPVDHSFTSSMASRYH